jgi:hypothetical protein
LLLPREVKDALDEVYKEANFIAAFNEVCISYDPNSMIAVPDFCLSVAGWWLLTRSGDSPPPSNVRIGRSVEALGDELIVSLRDESRRYYGGIKFNEEGKGFWDGAKASGLVEGKAQAQQIASSAEAASMSIPNGTPDPRTRFPDRAADWSDKPEVQRMREAHRRRRERQGRT